MTETAAVLLRHAALFPQLRPADAVKLLYQCEFGGEHLLPDPARAAERIRAEMPAAPDPAVPAWVPIGNRRARLDLRSADAAALGPERIARIFAVSARRGGTAESFAARLEELADAARRGALPFGADELDAFLARYDGGALRHSETYRRAYAPAYRVADAAFSRLTALICRLDALPRPAVAALDGDAASGKSTAAELLGQLFGAPVIHADDFYLPPELRTEARLAEPGGNFHRERFAAEVLPNLKTGRAFSYGAYDFHARATRRAEIPASELVFVEGAYCLHPALGDYADLRVFSPAAPDEQRRRILARNGEAGLAAFDARWIPMEKRYQAAFGVRARCDLTLPE